MSTIRVNAIQNTSGVEVYTAKAWVNFNGTGTVAIRASGNVSSITDHGTGDYTVNFTTAMIDTNYAVTGAAVNNSGGNGYRWFSPGSNYGANFSQTTSGIRVQCAYGTTLIDDATSFYVTVFR